MSEVEEAMERVWAAMCADRAQPRYLMVDGVLHEVITRQIEEAEALARVSSPAGLRQLFPSLRG